MSELEPFPYYLSYLDSVVDARWKSSVVQM